VEIQKEVFAVHVLGQSDDSRAELRDMAYMFRHKTTLNAVMPDKNAL
jgi:hypothetical protein